MEVSPVDFKILTALNAHPELISQVEEAIKKYEALDKKQKEEREYDEQHYYISNLCPICHPNEPGRIYPQAAETTCDYQCNICRTEFDVFIQDKKTKKVFKK